VTDFSKRTNEACETDDAAVGEQLGHLGDASNVLLAVLGAETEVLIESVSDVVSVQTVRWNAEPDQVFFQCKRDGSLASAR